MRYLLLASFLASIVSAQIRTYRTGMDVRGSVDARNATASWPFRSVGSAPSGACTNAAEWVQYTTTGDLYRCISGTWALYSPAAIVTWGGITGTLSAQSDLAAALALKAPLASPTFTGSVTLPTPATNDNSTLGATTAWVRAQNYLTTAPVTTVFGRSGAVVATTGDYLASQVTNAVDSTGSYSNPSWITSLAWGKVTGAPAFLTKSTATFASTTSLSIPAATHGFSTCGLVVRLWDNSSPRKTIEPDGISCNTSTFDLTITFATSQAGLYVIQ